MHLLGFFHEHTREDRDDYITVYLDNVISGRLLNSVLHGEPGKMGSLGPNYSSGRNTVVPGE